MKPYPLLSRPILKHRVWGGTSLTRFGKSLPPEAVIGESWELADLPREIEDGRSIIDNGPLAGRSLRDVIREHTELIMGHAALSTDGGFPLLIKLLDARENLSVQVHPTADYVTRHPDAHLKSEAWIVLAAEPGSLIYRGLTPGLTPEEFARHIQDGTAVNDLLAVPAVPGDAHYLPSGTCHALGAGIVVAEVQTPSDTTFRVYDWGRTGRDLHIGQAIQCINFAASPTPTTSSAPIVTGSLRTTTLVDCDFFRIDRIEATGPADLDIVTENLPLVYMAISGDTAIAHEGHHVSLHAGATALIPAALTRASARLAAGALLLEITLPSPAAGMIA